MTSRVDQSYACHSSTVSHILKLTFDCVTNCYVHFVSQQTCQFTTAQKTDLRKIISDCVHRLAVANYRGLKQGAHPISFAEAPSDSKKNGTEGDRFVLFVLISIPSVICWSILCLVRLTDDVAQVSMRITGGYMVELPIQPAPAAKKTFAPYKLLFV